MSKPELETFDVGRPEVPGPAILHYRLRLPDDWSETQRMAFKHSLTEALTACVNDAVLDAHHAEVWKGDERA